MLFARKSAFAVATICLAIPTAVVGEDSTPNQHAATPIAPGLPLNPTADTACGGFLFRSKKAEVAVYRQPELASEVVGRLSTGERVCHVGERGSFAIVMWRSEEKIAYVRLVDLWPPRSGPKPKRAQDDSVVGSAKRILKSFELGAAPALPPLPPQLPAGSPFSSSSAAKTLLEPCSMNPNPGEASCEK